jgi:actin-related protein
MDLDEMVCRSICSFDNLDQRKRFATSIILVGGPFKAKRMIEVFE